MVDVAAVVAGSLMAVVVRVTEMCVAAVVADVGAVADAGYAVVNAVGGAVVVVLEEKAKSYHHKAKGRRDEVTATYCEVDTVQKMVRSIVVATEHVFAEIKKNV